MITCEHASEEIDGVLDENIAPGEELNAHLKECMACQQHYESLVRLEVRLRTAANSYSEVLPGNGSSLALRIITERNLRRKRSRIYWLGAACVLIGCAGIAMYLSIESSRPAGPPLTARPDVLEKPLAEQAGAAPLNTILATPDKALKNEGEKLMKDVQAVEFFLLRCLPGNEPEKNG